MFRRMVQSTPDFPKPGIVYWDFTPILKEVKMRKAAIEKIRNYFFTRKITHVACIEAKGFIFGSMIAYELDLPMVLIRKKGLTPGEILSQDFIKEYGSSTYEMSKKACGPHDRVLIVYDILAGPGAAGAARGLIERTEAQVVGAAFVIELCYLNGREQLPGLDIFSLTNIYQEDADAVWSC